MKTLWVCPKCGRKFAKKNQSHSCKVYPADMHFKGKDKIAKQLYSDLKSKIKKRVGSFKVDSIQCCIHLVTTFTFAAVLPYKDKIKVHFTLGKKVTSKRVEEISRYSPNRYLYSVVVGTKAEIDNELLSWIKQAYNLNAKKNRMLSQ